MARCWVVYVRIAQLDLIVIITDSFIILSFMLNWFMTLAVDWGPSWSLHHHRHHHHHHHHHDAWRSASHRCNLSPERFVFCQLQSVGRSPEFSHPNRSDESMCLEVDLKHASSQETAGHRLEICKRSEGFGWLERHAWVWQRGWTLIFFISKPLQLPSFCCWMLIMLSLVDMFCWSLWAMYYC